MGIRFPQSLFHRWAWMLHSGSMTAKGFTVWPLAAFFVGLAFEVGGYQNPTVAKGLFSVSALLVAGWVGFLIGRQNHVGDSPVVLLKNEPPSTSRLPPPPPPKVFANISLAELSRRLEPGTTDLARTMIIETFKGRLFVIKGNIGDISRRGDRSVDIRVRTQDNFTCSVNLTTKRFLPFNHADAGYFIEMEAELRGASNSSLRGERHFIFHDGEIKYLGASAPDSPGHPNPQPPTA